MLPLGPGESAAIFPHRQPRGCASGPLVQRGVELPGRARAPRPSAVVAPTRGITNPCLALTEAKASRWALASFVPVAPRGILLAPVHAGSALTTAEVGTDVGAPRGGHGSLAAAVAWMAARWGLTVESEMNRRPLAHGEARHPVYLSDERRGIGVAAGRLCRAWLTSARSWHACSFAISTPLSRSTRSWRRRGRRSSTSAT